MSLSIPFMRNAVPNLLLLMVFGLAAWPPEHGPKSAAAFVGQGQAVSSAEKIAPGLLVEDLHIARRALEEGHSGIYRYTSKAQMDRIFERAEKSLDRPMNMHEFYRILAPVVASVKCGHTALLFHPGNSRGS